MKLNLSLIFLIITVNAHAVSTKNHIQPIFLVPKDVSWNADPNLEKRLYRHFEIARSHFLSMMKTGATALKFRHAILLHGKRSESEYSKGSDVTAYWIANEAFRKFKVDRKSSKQIFLFVLVREKTKCSFGGKISCFGWARSFNGFPGRGGGLIGLELASLMTDKPYPFQSTLVHEIGHALGLVHVSCNGFSMNTDKSIMSYNLKHHSRGFKQSKTPGILHPEHLYLLSFSQEFFPGFKYIPKVHNPSGRKLSRARKCVLGPMDKRLD